MVAAYVNNLETLVSKPRLDRYRPVNGDDLETLVTYLWNVSLCEALLQGLCAVEIGLRNSIHNVFTAHTGSDQWFWAILHKDDLFEFNGEWVKAARKAKGIPTAGKTIAHRTLGFWPRLFENRYQKLWFDNQSTLLKAVFPYFPPGMPPHLSLTRGRIFELTDLFRELRNRAMHHEPIFDGIRYPVTTVPPVMVALPDAHQRVLDMLDWIHTDLRIALTFVDRFPEVWLTGRADIESKVKVHFGIP